MPPFSTIFVPSMNSREPSSLAVQNLYSPSFGAVTTPRQRNA
jgi:hypothetical protein